MPERGLSEPFLRELESGPLSPLLDRVRRDATLVMELRDEYLNVYYRGGNLLKLSRLEDGTHRGVFDPKYARGADLRIPGAGAPVDTWIQAFPRLKQAIDLFPKNAEEREVQQQIVRANNFGGVARKTDFFVCDLEYANDHGRFDLVCVHWPNAAGERKKATRRLAVAEVKHGDGALTGPAGLAAHVDHVDAFLSSPQRVAALKAEMTAVFNQKRRLGLLDCGKDVAGFTDEPPLFMLMLANHTPRSTILDRELAALPEMRHAQLEVIRSSMLGYGLYDAGRTAL